MKKTRLEQAFESAVALHQAGQYAEAEVLYRKVLSQQPNHDDALHLLGVMAAQLDHFEEAVQLISRAITLAPNVSDYRVHLGNALSEKKDFVPAIESYRQALRLKPGNEHAHDGIANAHRELGRLDEAVPEHVRTLQINPRYSRGHYNFGLTLARKQLYDQAIMANRQTLALDPNYAEAHFNLSLLLLLKGNFQEGWAEYEWRWKRKTFPRLWVEFPQPRWNGEDIAGRTILIHTEQGYGDAFQFIRYMPMVAARGARVLLLCQAPLVRALKAAPGVDEVVNPDALPPFDVHCPMMSLPRIFQTRVGTVPSRVPYLKADADLSAAWAERLAPAQGRLKVGLAWAGSATHKNDKYRSLLLDQLAPLARAGGVVFYSLQKGAGSPQAKSPPPGMELIDFTEELNDFADSAALVSNLDLVISVDTGIVHLAGALGKPAWVLLATELDWRWMLDREDTPWYPQHRLFRQQTPGQWPEVIERVAAALKQAARSRGN